MNFKMIIFFAIIFSILITGCKQTPQPQTKYYSIEECKKELLDAYDYSEKESIDKIVVIKKERKMYLYKNNKVQSVVPISLGRNPEGTKIQEGDSRTPEGTFWLSRKLCSPKYYRSLCISYPRPEDVARAREQGVSPGGNITIHAQPKWNASGKANKYTLNRNWTQGCVAVTNATMKKLWYAVREGVPIIIR